MSSLNMQIKFENYVLTQHAMEMRVLDKSIIIVNKKGQIVYDFFILPRKVVVGSRNGPKTRAFLQLVRARVARDTQCGSLTGLHPVYNRTNSCSHLNCFKHVIMAFYDEWIQFGGIPVVPTQRYGRQQVTDQYVEDLNDIIHKLIDNQAEQIRTDAHVRNEDTKDRVQNEQRLQMLFSVLQEKRR